MSFQHWCEKCGQDIDPETARSSSAIYDKFLCRSCQKEEEK